MAYIGPGADSEETILVLTLQVEQFFDQSSFQMIATLSASNTQMNYTLAGLLASPVWLGGPALREFSKFLHFNRCIMSCLAYLCGSMSLVVI